MLRRESKSPITWRVAKKRDRFFRLGLIVNEWSQENVSDAGISAKNVWARGRKKTNKKKKA